MGNMTIKGACGRYLVVNAGWPVYKEGVTVSITGLGSALFVDIPIDSVDSVCEALQAAKLANRIMVENNKES